MAANAGALHRDLARRIERMENTGIVAREVVGRAGDLTIHTAMQAAFAHDRISWLMRAEAALGSLTPSRLEFYEQLEADLHRQFRSANAGHGQQLLSILEDVGRDGRGPFRFRPG